MEFKFTPQTIIFTVGPSNCGKTTIAEFLTTELQKQGYKTLALSSDAIRRELLNDVTLHKHDKKMVRVSKQAFQVLYSKVDNYTQYPVNYDFIIVDATNISELARKPLLEIAKKNKYNIVPLIFDYSEKSEYYRFKETEENSKTIINDMVKQYREELKNLNFKNYTDAIRIRKRIELDKTKILVENNLSEHFTSPYENVLIIGDVHGCHEELRKLIVESKMFHINENDKVENVDSYPDAKIILVGDYLDKNTNDNICKTIDFIYDNRDKFILVRGNHEKHCYDVLTEKIKRYTKQVITEVKDNGEKIRKTNLIEIDTEKELIEKYFTSVLLFDIDMDRKQKFMSLYENSYYYVCDRDDRFIVTHAPCSNNSLEKNNKHAYKAQNTIVYPKITDDIQESLQIREDFFRFIKDDAENCHPYHIFGHIAVSEVFKYRNKVNLDTGCYISGVLSGMLFSKYNKKPFFKSIGDKKNIVDTGLYPFFRTKANIQNIETFEYKTRMFLTHCAKNKIQFISGTMSPTNKNTEVLELESLQEGFNYYESVGINQVIVQPKKMGSRCNVYLFKDNAKDSYLISRNGYLIKPNTLQLTPEEFMAFKEQILEKYKYLFDTLGANFIILDGELLPWSAMSNGLIEKDFNLPFILKNNENNFLNNTGFYDLYEQLINNNNVLNEYHEKSKKDAIKFKNTISNYSSINDELFKYKKQVDFFSTKRPLDFSAFMILKYKAAGNKEEINCLNNKFFTNETVYIDLLKNDTYGIYDVKTKRFHAVYKGEVIANPDIYSFYELLTEKDMEEGVVLKPAGQAYSPNVAPYLKCRNSEYLRMTYGYNYLRHDKYKNLILTKNISRKLKTSIEEWELIRELLNISYQDININNEKYVTLMSKLHKCVEDEQVLDPRL